MTLNPPCQAHIPCPSLHTDDTETFTPQLTDMLVTSGIEEQEYNTYEEDDSEDSRDYNF